MDDHEEPEKRVTAGRSRGHSTGGCWRALQLEMGGKPRQGWAGRVQARTEVREMEEGVGGSRRGQVAGM